MLEFGSFLRAVNDRPYEWMTMSCLEFDGDSHTRKENWFLNDTHFGNAAAYMT